MIGKNLERLGEKAKEKGVSSKFVFTGFAKHGDVLKYVSALLEAVYPYPFITLKNRSSSIQKFAEIKRL